MITYGKQTINQTDRNAVIEALNSDFLTTGPKIKEFEDRIAKSVGAKYAVVVSNGTAALHLAVLSLGLKPGEIGITTPLTFVASANCLRYVKAEVQFADIEAETGLIDPIEIEKKIKPETKVLIPVHYAGQSCDMETISTIAKKHNLYVIEDAAHAIGSKYKGSLVGSCKYSDLCTFSFHPVKTITTGEGGAITTNNPDLYKKLLLLRTHGIAQRPDINPWFYEMTELGYNYRMPDILAALGISQLRRINEFINIRRKIVHEYSKLFAGFPNMKLLVEKNYNQSAFHLCPLLINFKFLKIEKKDLFEKLKEQDINLQVHYIPVHLHPYYKQHGFKVGDYPRAEEFYSQEISLPLYPTLSMQQVNFVVETIKNLIK